jgi:acyl carrier protein
MGPAAITLQRVRLLVLAALDVQVPGDGVDMIDSGLIDSLALVTLIAEIEDEFQIELPLHDLDLDVFRSIEKIAGFLDTTTSAAA